MSDPPRTPHRAVVFDVDGTLVDRRQRIHPLTRRALAALVARGIRRGLATGRSFRSARPYIQAIAADLPLVLFNGARVADPSTGAALHEARLPCARAREAMRAAPRFDLHVNLYLGDDLFVARLGRRARSSMEKDGLPAQPVGDLLAHLGERDPIKLLLIGAPERCDAFREAMIARWGSGADAPGVVRSEVDYVEVLPAGVNKGAALARAAAAAGLDPAEIVAFGDNMNDLELLSKAGLGVAMGGAPGPLRARADRVIGPAGTPALGRALDAIFGLGL